MTIGGSKRHCMAAIFTAETSPVLSGVPPQAARIDRTTVTDQRLSIMVSLACSGRRIGDVARARLGWSVGSCIRRGDRRQRDFGDLVACRLGRRVDRAIAEPGV